MIYRYFCAVVRDTHQMNGRIRENKIVRKMIGCERFAMNRDLDRLLPC